MSRNCPDDAAVLEAREFRGVTLDACPVCAGLYFDEGEIAALQSAGTAALNEVEEAAVPSDLAVVENPAPKRCPGCKALMQSYAYRYSSEIRLDGCPRCGGVWVQDGELAKIAAHLSDAPKSFGGVPTARREAEAQNASVRHSRLLRWIAPLVG